MSNKDRYQLILEELKKSGKVTIAFGRKHKIPQVSFYRLLHKAEKELGVGTQRVIKKRVIQKGGIDSFLNQYDDSVIIPKKIEAGVEKHLQDSSGDPCWMRDKDFREACGVGLGKWRRHADEYKELQVTVPGEGVIWGHPDIIDEMRRAVQR